MKTKPILVIACAALAREVELTLKANDIIPFELNYLSASWHNQPDRIPGEVRRVIKEAKSSGKYADIVVLYGDCGTHGELDNVLKEENVQRIQGSHCPHIFMSSGKTGDRGNDETGNYYLTDYMVKYFDLLCVPGLRLDSDPLGSRKHSVEGYKRLVYLAQIEDKELQLKAIDIADKLELEYVYDYTGLGSIETFLHDFSRQCYEKAKIH